ncbi:hypothetical protein NDU88_008057 [Pleurodeles waltl]|uniref:Uncharacterized protein n=1 Tax=Pleurodeles waltl TaxID=8319 RepID=A0AAV7N627_PLEWA|nr:hypothetical protein NDU88_008057 [Pleurodeles waltl]
METGRGRMRVGRLRSIERNEEEKKGGGASREKKPSLRAPPPPAVSVDSAKRVLRVWRLYWKEAAVGV